MLAGNLKEMVSHQQLVVGDGLIFFQQSSSFSPRQTRRFPTKMIMTIISIFRIHSIDSHILQYMIYFLDKGGVTKKT